MHCWRRAGRPILVRTAGSMDDGGDMDVTSSALERTCALQSRLRAAVQDLHPLSTSLDVDVASAEQERDVLLQLTCVSNTRIPVVIA